MLILSESLDNFLAFENVFQLMQIVAILYRQIDRIYCTTFHTENTIVASLLRIIKIIQYMT